MPSSFVDGFEYDRWAVYQNSSGTGFATPVRDILMHVLSRSVPIRLQRGYTVLIPQRRSSERAVRNK